MARFEMTGADIGSMSATGNADVLYELGILYSTGRNADLDLVTAHKWFNIAAAKGNHTARDRRAEVALQMSHAELASAQKAAREWMTLH